MSRHYHAYSEASSLEHDVQHLSEQELENLYGIEFLQKTGYKKGPVYDPVAAREYRSLHDWIAEQNEEDMWSDAEHHQISRKFDEDF